MLTHELRSAANSRLTGALEADVGEELGERNFGSSHTRLGDVWKCHPPSVLSEDSIFCYQTIRRLIQQ
jgi:hypothetical protein